MTIEITTPEDFEVMTISEIEGTINYSDDDVLTLNDGAELTISLYGYSAKLSSTGGESSLKVESDCTTYTASEGATFTMDYLDGTVSTLQNGSIIDTYEDYTMTVTEGTTFTANDTEVKYRLETAGTYNLNGAEITTTADGVEVALLDYNTVEFSADADITYNGETFSGDATVKITDGEISYIMTTLGESFTTDSREFNMISDAEAGVTVTTGDNSFDVAHVITEPEVEAYDDTTEDDLGKVFEEKVTIAGDDSYTVSSRVYGTSIVSGLSNGASVNAEVVFGGVENEYGTGFKFVTDEEGTFTFGDKTITIAGDNSVTLDMSFNADGTAAVDSYSGLDAGATILGVNETVENTESGITISGTDEADVISNSGENVLIDAGDGDNEISNSGDGTSIVAGAGNDTVNNIDADNVYISAGAGDNSIVSGCDNVTIVSEGGNDTINADGANTSIVAGNGNNVIYTSNGSATVVSGDGDDEIFNTDADAVYIDAGNGNNFVGSYLEYTVDSAADTLKNYYESETILTGSGNDTIANYGGYYVSISTGAGNDSIRSHHSYYNTIETGEGDDIIILQNGHYQYVDAGAGNDTIRGSIASGSGNWAVGGYATLLGGDGDDYINPSYANDSYIEGGSGNDTIISRGPRQTIDAGAGNDVISLGSANASESRTETTTSNLIITGGGDDTIYGYDETSTIQSGEVTASELSGKNVILTTDEGTLTIVNGKDKIISVNDETIAAGKFTVAEGETLELNGMTFTGDGNITLAGDSVSLGAGVAVDGADKVVLTKKGSNTINGQLFWTTEKISAGATVTADENGISMAHVIQDFPEDAGKILYEEATIAGDDSYGIRIDNGGIRSIYGISSGSTVTGRASLETGVGTGEFEADNEYGSVIVMGLNEPGVYTFEDTQYTLSGGIDNAESVVGAYVRFFENEEPSLCRIRFLDGTTLSGDFSNSFYMDDDGNRVGGVSVNGGGAVSIAGDDFINITGNGRRATEISGVSDGATIYGTAEAYKFTTDETGEFTVVNYGDYVQNFTVEGDDSVDFVLGYYTNSLGAEFAIEGDDDYNVVVSDGEAVRLVDISDGATLYSAGEAGKFITSEEGEFNLVNYTGKTQNFTVIGDDSVDFVLEHYTRPDGEAAFQVDGVSNFENGTLIIDSATAYHAVNIGESVPEIVANKDKVMHFGDDRPEDFWNDYATLQVVDSKVVSIDGISVMENITGDVTVHAIGNMTVNGAEIYAADDDYNVVVADGEVTSVVGVSGNATLKVTDAGEYTVNGSALEATTKDVIIVESRGAYIYSKKTAPIDSDTTTEELLDRFENASVVSENSTVDGGVAVVENTASSVTLTAAGDATVVTGGDNVTIDMADAGEAVIVPTRGQVELENYSAADGAGIRTNSSDIASAVDNSEIEFKNGAVILDGATISGVGNAVNLYNLAGEKQLVEFADAAGGANLDVSGSNDSAILIGGQSYGSTLKGGANDDTIYAGEEDVVNGGGGDNIVELSTARNLASDGVAIEIPTVRSATIVENFRTGFDASDDYIRADIYVSEISYVDGDVVINHDKSKVILKDVGDGDSAKILVDDDTAVIVAGGAAVKVGGKIANHYIGKKSGLDFSEYAGEVSINLDSGTSYIGDNEVAISGFNKIILGEKDAVVIGSDANEEIHAGSGYAAINGNGGCALPILF